MKSGEGTRVNLSNSASITDLNVYGRAAVTGQRSINTANVWCTGVSISQAPWRTNIGWGITATVGGRSLTPGEITVTVANGTFANDIAKSDVTVNNLLGGMNYTVVYNDASHIRVTLTGSATNHADANDTNIIVTVAQAKVTGAMGDVTTGNIAIDFNEPADTTAPVVQTPTVKDITTSGATVSITANETGTAYWVVYVNNATAPNAADIMAMVDSTGTRVSCGSGGYSTKDTPQDYDITGLNSNTQYDLYVVVEDAAGNVSSVRGPVDFKTNNK